MKKENGITLIALIITIIVLLILAGITINLTIGERGIITRAQEAGKNYISAQEKEEDLLNNFEKEMDNIINNIGTTTYKAYTLGDEVIIGTESFYVLKDSPADESTVTLLAKNNIDVVTLKQSATTQTVTFSSTNYWSSETVYPYELNRGANKGKYDSDITVTSAIGYAESYATKLGATGRLMTKAETDALKTSNSDLLFGRNGKSSSEYLNYWFGFAYNIERVGDVNGENNDVGSGYYYGGASYGVRPVIEISKSLI